MDLGSFSIGLATALMFVALMTKFYIPAYLKEKAKNLATKEDISEITEAIEKVRSQYNEKLQELIYQNNVQLEGHKALNQLRVVAPERRLQAHQEAFALWRKMLSSLHSDERVNVVMECQDWYNQNCLYLSAKSREAFSVAYGALAIHNDLLQDRTQPESVKRNYLEITNAGSIIVQSVELPALSADVRYAVKKDGGDIAVVEPEKHT
ncbi:hypothetical protein [Vibrio alginolyticus]|uniref:hypothetical protein n=1 Tax=Vibrio alginolyticus TaxID=663 RepID=UPI001BD303E9|nr:hypothetical protein [Vibrio alginolyticus]MBT0091054.1 hypothetical protein [Vibrio alginolyticus]MBY4650251.1 hypothetical protein [Vibrio alginolyticus]